MQRLVLIDGHAILHRAFHAIPPLTNSKGELINAAFGFISIMLRVVDSLKPTHLVAVFDRPKPTFRKKIYAEYQAKRPKMDEGLVPQIAMVHRVLERMNVPIFEMDGFEADDIIGTLVCKTKNLEPRTENSTNNIKSNADIETIIVTGDRDLFSWSTIT
jgi:DNA polymerase I